MTTRYVIVVRTFEGSVRVFGTYVNRERAEEAAKKINELIEAHEKREFLEWQEKNDHDEMAPDGHGRCHLRVVHSWDPDSAWRFALGEYDA
jgi:hypothetical protein